jgi:hypothetical protein
MLRQEMWGSLPERLAAAPERAIEAVPRQKAVTVRADSIPPGAPGRAAGAAV